MNKTALLVLVFTLTVFLSWTLSRARPVVGDGQATANDGTSTRAPSSPSPSPRDSLLVNIAAAFAQGEDYLVRQREELLTDSIDFEANVLILGDSISRRTIGAFCRFERAETEPILPDDWDQKAETCKTRFGRLAWVHMFGSSMHGPYYQPDKKLGPHPNTLERIPRAVKLYKQKFGRPTLIVYAIGLWDFLGKVPMVPFEIYESNVLNCIKLIRESSNNCLTLAINTNMLFPALESQEVVKFPPVYTDTLRKVAGDTGALLLDWEKWAASLQQQNITLARSDKPLDNIHPNDETLNVVARIYLQIGRKIAEQGLPRCE